MHMYPGKINCHTEHNYFRVLAAFILKQEIKQNPATGKVQQHKYGTEAMNKNT